MKTIFKITTSAIIVAIATLFLTFSLLRATLPPQTAFRKKVISAYPTHIPQRKTFRTQPKQRSRTCSRTKYPPTSTLKTETTHALPLPRQTLSAITIDIFPLSCPTLQRLCKGNKVFLSFYVKGANSNSSTHKRLGYKNGNNRKRNISKQF